MRTTLTILGLCLVLASPVLGEVPTESPDTDTMAVDLDVTIEVVGERVTRRGTRFPFEKERFYKVPIHSLLY